MLRVFRQPANGKAMRKDPHNSKSLCRPEKVQRTPDLPQRGVRLFALLVVGFLASASECSGFEIQVGPVPVQACKESEDKKGCQSCCAEHEYPSYVFHTLNERDQQLQEKGTAPYACLCSKQP